MLGYQVPRHLSLEDKQTWDAMRPGGELWLADRIELEQAVAKRLAGSLSSLLKGSSPDVFINLWAATPVIERELQKKFPDSLFVINDWTGAITRDTVEGLGPSLLPDSLMLRSIIECRDPGFVLSYWGEATVPAFGIWPVEPHLLVGHRSPFNSRMFEHTFLLAVLRELATYPGLIVLVIPQVTCKKFRIKELAPWKSIQTVVSIGRRITHPRRYTVIYKTKSPANEASPSNSSTPEPCEEPTPTASGGTSSPLSDLDESL